MAWAKVGNIKGPKGDQGIQGPQGAKGDPGVTSLTFLTPQTFALAGDVAVATLPGAYQSKAANQASTLASVMHKLSAGTATVQVRRNGAVLATLSATATVQSSALSQAIADGDYLDLNITAATGAKDLSVSLETQHTVT